MRVPLGSHSKGRARLGEQYVDDMVANAFAHIRSDDAHLRISRQRMFSVYCKCRRDAADREARGRACPRQLGCGRAQR